MKVLAYGTVAIIVLFGIVVAYKILMMFMSAMSGNLE